jgi:hypothetical protein
MSNLFKVSKDRNVPTSMKEIVEEDGLYDIRKGKLQTKGDSLTSGARFLKVKPGRTRRFMQHVEIDKHF